MQAARQRRRQLGGDGSIIRVTLDSKLITSDGRSIAATIVAPWHDRAAPLQVLITGSTLEAGSRI